MIPGLRAALLIASIVVLAVSGATQAADSTELEQCRALSEIPDDIHNCMDNFLDAMDVDMASYESLVINQLGGPGTEAGSAFSVAQASFKSYRRDNCLWYQAFSEPSPAASQLAKACLMDMSRRRLEELDKLLDQQPEGELYQGYYLFGDDRNTIVLCGSSERFWVTGDAGELSRLQQFYRGKTDQDNRLLYVVVTGEIDDVSDTSPYPGHEGLFKLSRVSDARLPRDSDCEDDAEEEDDTDEVLSESDVQKEPPATDEAESGSEPDTKLADTAGSADTGAPAESANPAPAADAAPAPPTVASVAADKTPSDVSDTPGTASGRADEALRAYFGAWVADCERNAARVLCVVSSAMQGQSESGILQPVLKLTRRSQKRTVIDLEFPGKEISTIDNILWRIDSINLGALQGSRMRAGDAAAVQELRQRALVRTVVLPQMIAGYELTVTVQDDSTQKYVYKGTLIGLTRALRFADDFISPAGN